MDTAVILHERGKVYGTFEDNALASQDLKNTIARHLKSILSADQAESLDMICLKLSRILTGDPNYPDNWDDIAGYAKLVADRVRS